MNVWLSSASRSPVESQPEDARNPVGSGDRPADARAGRGAPTGDRASSLWDQVQQIVWDQEPFLYLVNKDALMAFSPQLRNTAPAALQPQAYWNVDVLQKATQVAGTGK